MIETIRSTDPQYVWGLLCILCFIIGVFVGKRPKSTRRRTGSETGNGNGPLEKSLKGDK